MVFSAVPLNGTIFGWHPSLLILVWHMPGIVNGCMRYKEFVSTGRWSRRRSCRCPWWLRPVFWSRRVHTWRIYYLRGGSFQPLLICELLWITMVQSRSTMQGSLAHSYEDGEWSPTSFGPSSERSWHIVRAWEEKIGDQKTFGFHW